MFSRLKPFEYRKCRTSRPMLAVLKCRAYRVDDVVKAVRTEQDYISDGSMECRCGMATCDDCCDGGGGGGGGYADSIMSP